MARSSSLLSVPTNWEDEGGQLRSRAFALGYSRFYLDEDMAGLRAGGYEMDSTAFILLTPLTMTSVLKGAAVDSSNGQTYSPAQ